MWGERERERGVVETATTLVKFLTGYCGQSRGISWFTKELFIDKMKQYRLSNKLINEMHPKRRVTYGGEI